MKETCHVFSVEDATKFGIEKAILLYNIRFWLQKEFANVSGDENKTKIGKHTDGKTYVWTYNSAEAFHKIFPYISRRSISRNLVDLEICGELMSGNFNKYKYDKTKWYTMGPFEVQVSSNAQAIMSNRLTEDDQPIPYVNIDINTNVNNQYLAETFSNVLPSENLNGISHIDQLSVVSKHIGKGDEVSTVPKIQSKRKKKIKVLSEEEKEVNHDVNKVLVMFNKENPGVGYSNTTHRNSIKTLLKRYSVEQIGQMVDVVFTINGRDYAPVITTPYELLSKLSKLELYLDKNKL